MATKGARHIGVVWSGRQCHSFMFPYHMGSKWALPPAQYNSTARAKHCEGTEAFCLQSSGRFVGWRSFRAGVHLTLSKALSLTFHRFSMPTPLTNEKKKKNNFQ